MTTDSTSTDSDQLQEQFQQLEAKINAILPPRYQGCFEDVPAGSMGSAKLKYGADGKVAWDEIWTTFCHLALAGGPPHRGLLLESPPAEQIAAHSTEQRQVVAEIERAVRLATELSPTTSATPGWVGVRCYDEEMSAWLVRAIVAENVVARRDRNVLFLPAGPFFRLEKEIKNVVTSLAKTCHYLLDHVRPGRRPTGLTRSLVEPVSRETIAASPELYQTAASELERGIRHVTGLMTVGGKSPGWVGVKCTGEEMAVWMLRAIIVENVLVRREDDVICLPIGVHDAAGQGREKVLAAVGQAHRMWKFQATRSKPS